MKKLIAIIISITCAFTLLGCFPAPCEHEYGEWTVTTEPTLQTEGVETRYCNNCQNPETRPLSKLYMLTVTGGTGGTVSGGGATAPGKEVTVYAHTYSTYRFKGWYSGSEMVSSSTNYTFEMPRNSLELNALFEKFTFNFSVHVNNSELGSATYPKSADKGEQVTVTATPKGSNVFDGWYIGNELISTQPTYSFVMPSEDYGLTARFSIPEWDGTVATSFHSGTGDLKNPYLIETGNQLAYLSKLLSSETTAKDYNSKCYALISDINLNGKEWMPIGVYNVDSETESEDLVFKGKFYGQGYTVSNFKITSDTQPYYGYLGLFGAVMGTVKNLHIEGAEINVERERATKAGLLAGTSNRATIEDCSVQGSVNVTLKNTGGFNYAGGLIAYVTNMNVERCSAVASVTATSQSGATASGGLIACMAKDAGNQTQYYAKNVYSKGNVLANSQSSIISYAGGIVANGGNVKHAYHVGTVTSKAGSGAYVYCGGIAGNSVSVEYAYQDGDVFVETDRARPYVNLVLGDPDYRTQNYIFAEGTRYKNGVKYTYVDYLDDAEISGPTNATRRTFFVTTLKFDETYWQCYYVDLPSKGYPTLKKPAKEEF